MRPVRRELIERIVERGRIGDEQRRLPEVVQHQGGQGDGEPRQADRHAAEMAHVGIHRFAARHGQESGAQDGETDVEILVEQKIEGIGRADGGEHGRRAGDAVRCRARRSPGTSPASSARIFRR